MNSPLITIIIPVYNTFQYVNETLITIITQTYKNWECIIIDDGSSDGSLEKIKTIVKKDQRFKIFIRGDYSPIKGANVCRNIGLKKTKTKWVIFVDSDDLLLNKCLENRINDILGTSPKDIYIFKTAFIDEKKNITGFFYNRSNDIEDILIRLLQHNIPWHTMSPIWDVNFLRKIGGWNNKYERLQDIELNIRAMIAFPKIYFSPLNVDSYYRKAPLAIEKQKNARYGFCRIIKDYYWLLTFNELISENNKKKIHDIFQESLVFQLNSYINNIKHKDSKLERLFIQTLKDLKIASNEIERIKHLFYNRIS